VVSFSDITQRLEIQEELRQAEEQVRSLLNSTGEGIYGVDLAGNCTFANPACVALLGFEADDALLGQHMHKLVHHTRVNGEAYPVEECQIYKALWQREGTHIEDEVMWRADGSRFPAEYWSYPVLRDGELTGCVVTFVDISDRLCHWKALSGPRPRAQQSRSRGGPGVEPAVGVTARATDVGHGAGPRRPIS
jgi:PAS domain S-box-containing protein